MEEHKVTWSYSALKDYEGCARRYHEVKVLKKFPFQDTVQTRYGKDLHTAAELYVKDGTPLPEQFAFIKPTLDSLLSKRGRKFPEFEMAMTKDLNPCAFNSDNRWVRGIADLIIVDDDDFTARVVDYKSGNDKYPDRDQLVLMSLMVFKHFPHIKRVKSALLFVVKGSIVKHEMTIDDADKEWEKYKERVTRLEASYTSNIWNPTRTGLCGWCPVTDCEHHPRH